MEPESGGEPAASRFPAGWRERADPALAATGCADGHA